MDKWASPYAESRIWLAQKHGVFGVYTGHDCAQYESRDNGGDSTHAPCMCLNPIDRLFVCAYNGVVHACVHNAYHPFVDYTEGICLLGGMDVGRDHTPHDWETQLLVGAESGGTLDQIKWKSSATVQAKAVKRSSFPKKDGNNVASLRARGIHSSETRRALELQRLREEFSDFPELLESLAASSRAVEERQQQQQQKRPTPAKATAAAATKTKPRAQKSTSKRSDNLYASVRVAEEVEDKDHGASAGASQEKAVATNITVPRRKFWYEVDPLLPINQNLDTQKFDHVGAVCQAHSSRMQWVFAEEEEYAAASCGEPTSSFPDPALHVPQTPLCLADYFWETFLLTQCTEDNGDAARAAYSESALSYGHILAEQLQAVGSKILPSRYFGLPLHKQLSSSTDSLAEQRVALADAVKTVDIQELRARKSNDWRPVMSELLNRELQMLRRYPYKGTGDWIGMLETRYGTPAFTTGIRLLICVIGHLLGTPYSATSNSELVGFSSALSKYSKVLMAEAYSSPENLSLLAYSVRMLGDTNSPRRMNLRLRMLENAFPRTSYTPHPLWIYEYTLPKSSTENGDDNIGDKDRFV